MDNKTFICFISHAFAKIKDLFGLNLNQKLYAERDTDNRLYKKTNTILTILASCVQHLKLIILI